MCTFEFIRLTTHHFVYLDLSYKRLKVDIIVLDLTLVFFNIDKLLLCRLILYFLHLGFCVGNNFSFDLLLDIVDVLKAYEFAENLFICT